MQAGCPAPYEGLLKLSRYMIGQRERKISQQKVVKRGRSGEKKSEEKKKDCDAPRKLLRMFSLSISLFFSPHWSIQSVESVHKDQLVWRLRQVYQLYG